MVYCLLCLNFCWKRFMNVFTLCKCFCNAIILFIQDFSRVFLPFSSASIRSLVWLFLSTPTLAINFPMTFFVVLLNLSFMLFSFMCWFSWLEIFFFLSFLVRGWKSAFCHCISFLLPKNLIFNFLLATVIACSENHLFEISGICISAAWCPQYILPILVVLQVA